MIVMILSAMCIYYVIHNFKCIVYRRERIYGNENDGDGSQPLVMIAFYRRYAKFDPLWNVRHLGW